MISLGAKKVVVPGLYTIFRLPIYRTAFPGSPDMWEVNDDLAIHHNVRLARAIDKLNRDERPDAAVVYGDYYSAFESMESYAVGGTYIYYTTLE